MNEFNIGDGYRTGSRRQTNITFTQLRDGFKSIFYQFESGIDAPEVMAAGSMNSTEWVKFNGEPSPAATEFRRNNT